MRPSVGRIVHYLYEDGCLPAIVIAVRYDSVDLFWFYSGGGRYESYVTYAPDDKRLESTWHWPERVEE